MISFVKNNMLAVRKQKEEISRLKVELEKAKQYIQLQQSMKTVPKPESLPKQEVRKVVEVPIFVPVKVDPPVKEPRLSPRTEVKETMIIPNIPSPQEDPEDYHDFLMYVDDFGTLKGQKGIGERALFFSQKEEFGQYGYLPISNDFGRILHFKEQPPSMEDNFENIKFNDIGVNRDNNPKLDSTRKEDKKKLEPLFVEVKTKDFIDDFETPNRQTNPPSSFINTNIQKVMLPGMTNISRVDDTNINDDFDPPPPKLPPPNPNISFTDLNNPPPKLFPTNPPPKLPPIPSNPPPKLPPNPNISFTDPNNDFDTGPQFKTDTQKEDGFKEDGIREDNVTGPDINSPDFAEESSHEHEHESSEEGRKGGHEIGSIMSSINDLFNTFSDPTPQPKENVFTPLFDDEVSD